VFSAFKGWKWRKSSLEPWNPEIASAGGELSHVARDAEIEHRSAGSSRTISNVCRAGRVMTPHVCLRRHYAFAVSSGPSPHDELISARVEQKLARSVWLSCARRPTEYAVNPAELSRLIRISMSPHSLCLPSLEILS